MPHPILAASTHLCQLARGAIPTRWSPPLASVARWSADRATAWQRATEWLVGCNFTPSTAGNQLEMCPTVQTGHASSLRVTQPYGLV